MTYLPAILNKNTQKAHEWLLAIMEYMDLDKEQENQALAVLRATLQELRDNLPLNNAANFSAQLPLIIRGLFFETWNPEHTLLRERNKEAFLNGVMEKLLFQPQDIHLEKAVRAVMKTISVKTDGKEFEKLKKVLPAGIRELMP